MGKRSIESFLIGLGVGVVIGGVIGLLFAPQPGKETRKLVAEKVRDIKYKIKPTLDTVTKK